MRAVTISKKIEDKEFSEGFVIDLLNRAAQALDYPKGAKVFVDTDDEMVVTVTLEVRA